MFGKILIGEEISQETSLKVLMDVCFVIIGILGVLLLYLGHSWGS